MESRSTSTLPPAPRRRLGLAIGSLMIAGTPALADPGVGRYDATLCVRVAAQPRHCGPALVEVHAGGGVKVQISDFVYQLVHEAGQPAIVVNHGALQVDAFPTRPLWAGNALRFEDDEKRVHYEVQVGAPRR